VAPVNHAPTLNANIKPSLTSIAEDTKNPAGTAISTLMAGISDADNDALKGLAITSLSGATNGTWQFTLDGGDTWTNFGAVSSKTARLLPSDGADSRIRFVPKLNFHGTVKVGYYAWDQNQGIAGKLANISHPDSRGGSTAYSGSSRQSSLVVTSENDAPVLSVGGTVGYVHNNPAVKVAAFADVVDVDSLNLFGARLTVEYESGASTSNRLSLGTGFTVDASNNVKQGNVIIGKRTSGGFGLNPLSINFTAKATPAIVQQLLRSMTFKTTGGAAGQRTLLFTLTDGDDGTATDTKIINVT
jgi:hypothetical protein